MQSFLQYRRFGKQLEAQIERNRERTAELRRQRRQRGPTSDTSSDAPTLGEEEEEEYQDKDEQLDEKKDERGEGDAGRSPSRASSRSSGRLEGQQSTPLDMEPAGDLERADYEDQLSGSGHVVYDPEWPEDLRTIPTHGTMGTTLGLSLTGIEVRDRTTKEGGAAAGKVFVVAYEGENDPMDPRNWSFARRLTSTLVISLIGGVVGWASSIDSAALPQGMAAFGVSDVAESLATGLFLIGFGTGALVSGPFSETLGRNPVYIGTLAIYMLFIMGAGLAPNLGTQLVCRFFAGMFGSTPLVCAGGSLSDMWTPIERVYAFPIFACCAFVGPVCGPVPGSFIGQSSLISWRWVEWITLIFSGLVLAIVVLTQPETYGPVLLKWKAQHLRRITGDKRYRAAIEVRQTTFMRRLLHALYRPFLLTMREPIIILVALYLTVIYIILFTFLTGYTFIFTDTYGFSQGLTGVCFVGISIGIFLGGLLVPFAMKKLKQDLARAQEQGHSRVHPEVRLYFSMWGAPAIPVSLFWMGWTTRPDISPWSPLGASVLFGYGIICVFISCYQYVIDSYETYAASALAAVTVIRYVAAGGMIEVSLPFYKNLGVAYTLTILGAISAALVPVPYVFFKYGEHIRRRSKYAVGGRRSIA
ncbi:hypothetical protein DTO271G3_3967 [Paecilomyces variotii]|nr:hypothetical protein DTO271G3_3967 [Paecilomyces variotii]